MSLVSVRLLTERTFVNAQTAHFGRQIMVAQIGGTPWHELR